jgi:hypothetical protein
LREWGYAHCWKHQAVRLSERSHSPKREAVCQPECSHCQKRRLWAGRAGRMVGRSARTPNRRGSPVAWASARGRSGAALRGAETLRDWTGDAHRPEREAQPGKLPANGLDLEVRGEDPEPERRKLESQRGKPSGSSAFPHASGPRLERQDANPEAPTRNPKAHDANPKAYPAPRRVHGADREAKTDYPEPHRCWAEAARYKLPMGSTHPAMREVA